MAKGTIGVQMVIVGDKIGSANQTSRRQWQRRISKRVGLHWDDFYIDDDELNVLRSATVLDEIPEEEEDVEPITPTPSPVAIPAPTTPIPLPNDVFDVPASSVDAQANCVECGLADPLKTCVVVTQLRGSSVIYVCFGITDVVPNCLVAKLPNISRALDAVLSRQ